MINKLNEIKILGVFNMNAEKLRILMKLGILEAFQSFAEGDGELNSYYFKENEDEDVDDDFFKEDLED
jgi:hypothetical protein